METPTPLTICYWLCIFLVSYTYVGYPAILWVLTRWRARPVHRLALSQFPSAQTAVSVVLTAHNEEETIGRRLTELLDHFATQRLSGEVIVVSDGSTDRTVEIASAFGNRGGAVPVRLIVFPSNVGKSVALSAGCAAAESEILVFADVRQSWAPDALVRLLENFADPMIGAVSGELRVESGLGVMQAVGFYWRYEKWIRQKESLLHSTVGLTGSICAVRRNLFRPIPAGTLLDDVYWPLNVVMQGYRVVFDNRACAYDRLPDRMGSEFRRKVRTLTGNFQLVTRLWEACLPWRNPIWFSLFSHKLARLAVPWAMIVAFGCAVALGGELYGVLLAIQVAGLGIAFCGLVPAISARSRLVSIAGAFFVLNAAAWWAFWVWVTGRASRSWTKVSYKHVGGLVVPRLSSPATD